MSYSSEVLADSPVAYWRLDEPSGTTMGDSSGNGRDGTYAGSPGLGATGLLVGDADTAINFSGVTTERASVADAAWMDVSAITVEAVIKPDDFSATRMIADRDVTSNRVFQFRTELTTGKLQALVWSSTNVLTTLTAPSGLTVGSTYHVAFTYEGTTIRLYQNGTEVANVAKSATLKTGTAPIAVGVGHGGGTASQWFTPFDGVLDEVAIYGTALSAARVLAHYTAAVASSAAGTGDLTLGGSGASGVNGIGSGSLTLGGSASGISTNVTGTGSLALGGSAAAQGHVTGIGSLTLGGVGTAVGSTPGTSPYSPHIPCCTPAMTRRRAA